MKLLFLSAIVTVLFLVAFDWLFTPSKANPSIQRIIDKASHKIYKPTPSEKTNGMKPITILLFGRTRAGKSSLGNKLSGSYVFEVGDGLESNTTSSKDTLASLEDEKGRGSYLLRIIDTPGFADNRADRSHEDVLSDILAFVANLQGGIEIGIYCIPAGSGVSSHDINELNTIGLLLGKAVFNHTLIAVTKANTLSQEQRDDSYMRYPSELPKILQSHGLFEFESDRVLFADFDIFQKKFVSPFSKFLAEATNYQPQMPKDLNFSDVESVATFFASPVMQEIMQKKEELLVQQMKMAEMVLQKAKDNEEKFEKKIEEKEEEINKNKKVLEEINQKLENSHLENGDLKESLIALQQEQNRTMAILQEQKYQLAGTVQKMNEVMKEKEKEIERLEKEKNDAQEFKQAQANSKFKLFQIILGAIFIVSSIIVIMLLWRFSKTFSLLAATLFCLIIALCWVVKSFSGEIFAAIAHSVMHQLASPSQ